MPNEKRNDTNLIMLIVLAVAAIAKAIVAGAAFWRLGWDPEAPVPMKYFVGVVAIESVAIIYLLLKVLYLGTPAVLM